MKFATMILQTKNRKLEKWLIEGYYSLRLQKLNNPTTYWPKNEFKTLNWNNYDYHNIYLNHNISKWMEH